jgi:WD40 repeat protein
MLSRFDIPGGQPIDSLVEVGTNVYSMAMSPDGHTLATGSLDGTIRLFDTQPDRPLVSDVVVGPQIVSLAFDREGNTLAVAADGLTFVETDKRPALTRAVPLDLKEAASVAWSPDAPLLAVGTYDGRLTLVSAITQEFLGQPLETENWWRSLAFSPNGAILAAGMSQGTVVLFDTDSREPLGRLHASRVVSIAWSPDGRTLAAGTLDGTVLFFDAEHHRPLGPPLRASEELGPSLEVRGVVESVAWSPDGRTVAAGIDDGTVALLDYPTRRRVGVPLEVGGSGASLAFSPNGDMLAVGNSEDAVTLFDVRKRRPVGSPFETEGGVLSLAWSPDGDTLAAGRTVGRVVLVDVAVESWLNRACAIANRNLTKDEWDQFIGRLRPYRATCPYPS